MKYVDRQNEKKEKEQQAEYQKLLREEMFKNSILRRLNEIRWEHHKKNMVSQKETEWSFSVKSVTQLCLV